MTAHEPVLLSAVIAGLSLSPGQTVIDGTVGAGGHAAAILTELGPTGQFLGLDVDPQALALTADRLAGFEARIELREASYDQLQPLIHTLAFPTPNAILVDLGVSSMQLDQAERGFSFRQDGPLDMRMQPSLERSAADLVNTLPEQELANLIYQYGEERRSRSIARAIVAARPVHRTGQLADIVARAGGRSRRQKIHPATRTFQALRIAVNDELGHLTRFLPQAIAALAPGGRLAVISFHSLEDRLVKQYFQQEARDCLCPPEQPVCTCGHQARIRIVTRKPISAGADEIARNPRARSARLRVAERLST